MADRKPLHIEPISEMGGLLELAREAPVSVEYDGTIYRIDRQGPLPVADIRSCQSTRRIAFGDRAL